MLSRCPAVRSVWHTVYAPISPTSLLHCLRGCDTCLNHLKPFCWIKQGRWYEFSLIEGALCASLQTFPCAFLPVCPYDASCAKERAASASWMKVGAWNVKAWGMFLDLNQLRRRTRVRCKVWTLRRSWVDPGWAWRDRGQLLSLTGTASRRSPSIWSSEQLGRQDSIW